MLRPSAILGVLFALSTFACPALGSGDPSVETANEDPQVVIKRILESDRPNAEKAIALRQFVQLGDSESMLDRKLGKPWIVLGLIPEGRGRIYQYEFGLIVVCELMKIEKISYRRKGGDFVPLISR